jgi:hypothetical protein
MSALPIQRSIDEILESINLPVGINNGQKTRYSNQFKAALQRDTVEPELQTRMENMVIALNDKITRADNSQENNGYNQERLESRFSIFHKAFGPYSGDARLNVDKQTREAIALKKDLTNSRDLLKELIPLVGAKLDEQQTATDAARAAAIEADREGTSTAEASSSETPLSGSDSVEKAGGKRRSRRRKSKKQYKKKSRRSNKRITRRR